MTVREATAADVPALVAMGERFVDDVYPGLLRPNVEQFARLAAHLIVDGNSLLLVADDGAGPVGMFGGMVYPHPMSGERIAAELFWWMNPEARGVAGVKLLHRAEAWARAQGAVVLQMIAPDATVARFYERVGFSPVETTYQRRLDP